MATCPSCHTRYPDDARSCAADGEALLPDSGFIEPELAASQRVGEYQIELKVGEGGFGCVYRAVHPLIGKTVAIKVLNRQYSSNPQMVSRFVAEARAVNQIRNRNIIDIFSFGTLDDGRHYYVMELLEGMTLDRYVKEKGRLGPEVAIPILRGLARALDAAHAAGIAHRDLKPENIFLILEDDGAIFPKLLDFGIAKLLGDSGVSFKTRTGQPIGTPYYMSPEQCRGKDVDHRTDIYSFGILVHEALTGRIPFTGDNLMDLLVKQTTAEPPRVSSVCAELPASLDGPILDMLKKDPAERPASVGAAIEALARAAQDAGYAVQVAPRAGDLRRSGDRAPITVPPRSGMTPAQLQELSDAKTISGPSSGTRTLLNAATDVPPSSRRRVAVLVGSLSLAAGLAGAVAFASSSSGAGRGPALAAMRLPALPVVIVAPPEPTVAIVPEPPSSDVELTLQASPKDVEVYLGGQKIGTSAGTLKIKRGDTPIKLTLKAAGYAPTDVEVTPSANVTVPARLVKLSSRRSEVEF